MKKLSIALVFVFTVGVINVPSSEGYPWIFTRWRAKYLQPVEPGQPDPFKQQVMDAGCLVCHTMTLEDAPNREMPADAHNDYGQKLADILGDPQELADRFKNRQLRDAVNDQIDAALEEVGGQDTGDGQTFDQSFEGGALLPYQLPEDWEQEN